MCSILSDKADRIRIGLTLTKIYVEALNYLVDEGIYMEHQEAIRGSLRRLFRHHGIEPFTDKGAEPDPEAAAPSEP